MNYGMSSKVKIKRNYIVLTFILIMYSLLLLNHPEKTLWKAIETAKSFNTY